MSNVMINVSTTSGSTLIAVLLAGGFTLLAIFVKDVWEARRRSRRIKNLLTAELADIERHYGRNLSRIETMISALKQNFWPVKLHIEKLEWPEDTAFSLDSEIAYLSSKKARLVYKFRLRLRNANLDVRAALRIYNSQDEESTVEILQYCFNRHLRIMDLAAYALKKDGEGVSNASVKRTKGKEFQDVDDMVFLPKAIIFRTGKQKIL